MKSNNLGDGFNPLIFNHFISNKRLQYRNIYDTAPNNTDSSIIGIGSILSLNNKIDTSNHVIVGSGFIDKKLVPQRPRTIISVRGPKTRRKFLDANIPCPRIYGDLGLLLRYIVPPPMICDKKYTFGFIPHNYDKYSPFILKAMEYPGWKVIDINQADNVTNFVKEIHECKYILSSSLHGIIIADSYGIPAYHTMLSNKLEGGLWKFKDYYASIHRKYSNVDITSMDEKMILKQMKPYHIDFDFDGYYRYIKDELSKL
jgi:pyruvyltransferase